MKVDKYDSDINFSKVLFLHINRILMMQEDNLFISSVGLFEDALSPYLDDLYYDDLDGVRDGVVSVSNLDPSIKGKKNLLATEEMKLARLKFRALMKLAERKDLLLEKRAYGEDEEDE